MNVDAIYRHISKKQKANNKQRHKDAVQTKTAIKSRGIKSHATQTSNMASYNICGMLCFLQKRGLIYNPHSR